MASPATGASKKDSVRILICSGNMGNAKPDTKSLGAWIPIDGLCKFAIPPMGVRPEFPIVMDPRKAKNPPLPQMDAEGKPIDLAVSKSTSEESDYQKFERMFADQREEPSVAAAAAAVATGGESPVPTSLVPKKESGVPLFENVVFDTNFANFDETNAPAESPMAPKGGGPRDLASLENSFPANPFGDLDSEPAAPSQNNLFDAIYRSGASIASDEDDSQFDIIVIGMQEATFNMEEEAEKNEGEGEGETDEKPEDDDNGDVESLSSSSSGEDEMGGNTDDERGFLQDEDTTAASTLSTLSSSFDGESQKKSKKSKVKALGGALSKIGKAATKKVVKVADKVGKVTVKNAKTAKTLLSERDNTEKTAPTPQQITNLEEEMTTWSDTTVLHYMFEEQLPSYKRALSYQLGEMRLVIYYKETEVDVNLLSVKTSCTGKHGLANKGGIVAEIAVNETTRLGFLTAHLEAHVSGIGFGESSTIIFG
jgi:hypothetical protein